MAVGLVQNPGGVPYKCGTCHFYGSGICHNTNPKLQGRGVRPTMCCNFYKHPDMKVIEK